jgi:hypothetical protein
MALFMVDGANGLVGFVVVMRKGSPACGLRNALFTGNGDGFMGWAGLAEVTRGCWSELRIGSEDKAVLVVTR